MYNLSPKVKDPISIFLGKKEQKLIFGKDGKDIYPLDPGIVLGEVHYGFIIITENGSVQKEQLYPTECNISAIGIQGGEVLIYEEGKKLGWTFTKKGVLCRSIIGEEVSESYFKSEPFIEMASSKIAAINGQPIVKNPVRIEVDSTAYDSNIVVYDQELKEERCPFYQEIKQEKGEKKYPVYPGVVLGTEHYGFTIVMKTGEIIKEKTYPTQNPIYGIATQGYAEEIQIFEEEKYHPWKISKEGEMQGEAHYEPCSRRDMAYMEEHQQVLEEGVNKKYKN